MAPVVRKHTLAQLEQEPAVRLASHQRIVNPPPTYVHPATLDTRCRTTVRAQKRTPAVRDPDPHVPRANPLPTELQTITATLATQDTPSAGQAVQLHTRAPRAQARRAHRAPTLSHVQLSIIAHPVTQVTASVVQAVLKHTRAAQAPAPLALAVPLWNREPPMIIARLAMTDTA